jgi:hypothetical protein
VTLSHDAVGPADASAAGESNLHFIPTFDALTPEELAKQWEAEKPPAAGPLANLGAAAVVVGISIVGIVGAVRLGVGTPERPRAGTWPLIISLVMLVLGIALAATAKQTHDTEKFTRESWGVLAGLATMAGFAAVIGTVGFEIPALLLAFFWLKVLGRESWRLSIIGSLLMVAAFYALFVVALSVSIPHRF